MDNELIIKYNIKIAKFLGTKISCNADEGNTFSFSHHKWAEDAKADELYYGHELRFHSDWNWLMQAVIYIESIKYTCEHDGYSKQRFYFNSFPDCMATRVEIHDCKTEEDIVWEIGERRIATFDCIILFIDIYEAEKQRELEQETKKREIANNVLIAKFLGYTPIPEAEWVDMDKRTMDNSYCTAEGLQFDSLDHLLPVLSHIEDICNKETKAKTFVCNLSNMTMHLGDLMIVTYSEKVKADIVRFITWYKLQQIINHQL